MKKYLILVFLTGGLNLVASQNVSKLTQQHRYIENELTNLGYGLSATTKGLGLSCPNIKTSQCLFT